MRRAKEPRRGAKKEPRPALRWRLRGKEVSGAQHGTCAAGKAGGLCEKKEENGC